jgi:hypothetical protein
VELRALQYGANTDAERDALQAIYAFEEVRSQKAGRRVRASRTWQSIQRHGIIPTVERVVGRRTVTEGYDALVNAGMDDFNTKPSFFATQTSFLRRCAIRREADCALTPRTKAPEVDPNQALIRTESLWVRGSRH